MFRFHVILPFVVEAELIGEPLASTQDNIYPEAFPLSFHFSLELEGGLGGFLGQGYMSILGLSLHLAVFICLIWEPSGYAQESLTQQ